MAWDTFFKQILKEELSGFEVQSNVPVGKLPLSVDLVIIRPDQAPKIPVLQPFVNRLSDINVLEFKSARDSIAKSDLSKLIGYIGLYCENKSFGVLEMKKITGWYIIPNMPRYFTELNLIQEEEGIYLFKFYFPIYIIVIDQLEIKVDNMPFLLFSSKKRLALALKKIVREKSLQKYLSIAYLLYPEGMKKLAIEEQISFEEIQKNIRSAVEELGTAKVIEAVGLAKVIEAVGLAKVIEAVGLAKVIEAVGPEKVIEAVGLEKVKSILNKLEKKGKIKNKRSIKPQD